MRDTDVPATEELIANEAMFTIGAWSLTSRRICPFLGGGTMKLLGMCVCVGACCHLGLGGGP